MRDEAEIIPDGNTFLRGGDRLEIIAREADIPDVETIVEQACHKLV
jgi:Trk K+ transport system NAD-binding subunit